MQHEVVRQLLACLSHVGVSSKILQASPLQGSKATKPDQRAERLVNHFRRYMTIFCFCKLCTRVLW